MRHSKMTCTLTLKVRRRVLVGGGIGGVRGSQHEFMRHLLTAAFARDPGHTALALRAGSPALPPTPAPPWRRSLKFLSKLYRKEILS